MYTYSTIKNINIIDVSILHIKIKDIETILKYYGSSDFDEMVKSMKREIKIREIMEYTNDHFDI